MRRSPVLAVLVVLFAACPAAAQQPPGLAESADRVPETAPPGMATGSSGGVEAPVGSPPGESFGGARSLRDENELLKRKVEILEKQVELLRQRVKSLEGGP